MKQSQAIKCSSIIFFAVILLITSIKSTGQTVAVAPVKMNVLYIGVDNPLSVAVSDAADSRVTVSISGGGGTVSKVDAGVYNVRVTTATNDCTINVYTDGKLTGSTTFRVRLLPEPSAAVGGFISGADINADALRKQAGVGVYIVNFPFDIKYEVVGFTVVLKDDKGNLNTIPCDGALFSENAKQYLNQYTKAGDIVTIENIRVKGPNGQIKLTPLLYHIK